ncbi:hypothetical protein [Rubricoccus marinus]|uniref:Glycosyltransferase RgtA/B/C/D-like domain-containing protein n=1 Tax=Rubricoccus marinus TaxID=716817 RepID=A0A259U0Q2_9BACT|nr:hypothetical protein [Rubricoccus marinus]OZC03418.1 hypothetical protein BSZ36_10765 [Rubricoccus marinus]
MREINLELIPLYDSPLGVVAMLMVYLFIAFGVSTSRLRPALKWLLWGGLAARVVGVLLRDGIKADAIRYYKLAGSHALHFAQFDFSPFWDSTQWWGGRDWMGSNIIPYPAGFIMVFLGQNIMAVFFAYALIAFVGLLCYVRAFENSLPRASSTGYMAWICLFPSLWFWPSSIGKEALMTFGLGVATLAYLRYDGRTRWALLVAGLSVVFVIRPQVVAVFAMAMVLSTFLDFKRWTPLRILQGAALLGIGFAMMWYSLRFAVEMDGVGTVEDYVATNANNSTQGGSEVGAASMSPVGVFVSILNVLFRPFLWEAHNVTAAFAAIEVSMMWGIIFVRRRQIAAMFRVWRNHLALRFAIPFTALYVIALGMNLGNLGIIARQRVLVFPLFFLIVEAGTMAVAAETRRRSAIPPAPPRFPMRGAGTRPVPT